MTHLVCEEARKRGRKIGLFFLDWEAQFTMTIDFARRIFKEYEDCIEPYWMALPIKTWNAVSMYEPEWKSWDETKKNLWVRQPEPISITDPAQVPFWYDGIMFEEFVPTFGQWYAQGEKCACFVGIRAQESLNRFRTLAREKPMYDGKPWTTNVVENVWNVYPIYDWQTEDIWTYHGKTGKDYNKLYDRMYQAGMTVHQMRICEPFGDESRKGLWLYSVIEPSIWARLVLRVNGANTDLALPSGTNFYITGPTDVFTISGLAASGGNEDGRVIRLYNSVGFAMTIANDATSTAANRILTLTGADVTTTTQGLITLVYSTTASRWINCGSQV
jgi:predicted phosphoadenosine phosphosulfate sulfurtransferase